MLKIKNNIPFQTVGTKWCMWVPENVTIKVEVSPDGKDGHFATCAEGVAGPDMFQCSGYNEGCYFKVSGFGGKTLEVLT